MTRPSAPTLNRHSHVQSCRCSCWGTLWHHPLLQLEAIKKSKMAADSVAGASSGTPRQPLRLHSFHPPDSVSSLSPLTEDEKGACPKTSKRKSIGEQGLSPGKRARLEEQLSEEQTGTHS
jgi:hypothetical protein